MALDIIKSDDPLQSRLLLRLVVLLHDPASRPRAWACRASGHLVARGRLADAFAAELFERLLELAKPTQAIEVRSATAIGLKALMDSNWPDTDARERIVQTLAGLSNDVSFQVHNKAVL